MESLHQETGKKEGDVWYCGEERHAEQQDEPVGHRGERDFAE